MRIYTLTVSFFLTLLPLLIFSKTTPLIPKGFIENNGQIADMDGNVDKDILFSTGISGANIFFTTKGLRYYFYHTSLNGDPEVDENGNRRVDPEEWKTKNTNIEFYRLDMEFANGNPDVKVSGGTTTGVTNNFYLSGNANGLTNIPQHNEIFYKEIYPGIDARFYYLDGELKYDFIVSPGADPSVIKLSYTGDKGKKLTAEGSLLIETPLGSLEEKAPYTYYKEDEKLLESAFQLNEKDITFSLKRYDSLKTLIIDPVLSWGTYFDNNYSSDTWSNVAIDNNGNVFAASYTYAATYPPNLNPGGGAYYSSAKNGFVDLILIKFNSNLQMVWCTYFGGNNAEYMNVDYGKAVAVDNSGNFFVVGRVNGSTTSFPTLNPGGGAFYQTQSKIHGDTPFFLKFNNNGVLLWSTIFNHENANTSSAGMQVNAIACDGNKIWFTGQTYRFNSNNIPLRNPGGGAYYNNIFVGDQDIFVGRLSNGGVLEWSTYFNHKNTAEKSYDQGSEVHVDDFGNFWVTGRAGQKWCSSPPCPATPFPTVNPGGGAYVQTSSSGQPNGNHIFITKFTPQLTVYWSTLYGGNSQDIPSMIDSDPNGNIFIIGRGTQSTDFPTYNPGGGAYYQSTKLSSGSNWCSFILKFTNNGVRQWASYITGSGTYNAMTALGVDNSGMVYAGGYVNSTNMPIQFKSGSYNQSTFGGANDGYFMQFNNNGVLQWASYVGTSGTESFYYKGGISKGACGGGDFYSFGGSSSTNSPTANPGSGAWYQSTPTTANANYFLRFSSNASAGGGGGTPGIWGWTGAVNNDWFEPCNWDKMSVPTSTSPARIPGGTPNNPVIGINPDKNAHCYTLEVVSTNGAHLEIMTTSGGTLQVHY